MNRPLSMDDSKFPRIRRFEIHSDPVCALDLSADQSRFMSDVEIRQLRDMLNADAADATCKPTEHMSGRASVIEHVRCAADNFNESYWPDFEHMTAAEQDDVWAEVHATISTCLIALGVETVARVTTDELRCLSLYLATAHENDAPLDVLMAIALRASDELAEMSKRTEHDPPTWTTDPPARDCFYVPPRSGRNTPISMRYRDGRYWTDQSSYSTGHMLYSGENGGRFLVIPGGIPVCPEVTS